MGFGSKVKNSLQLVGIDPGRLTTTVLGLPRFVRDLRRYRRNAASHERFPAKLRHLKPILTDYRADAGAASGHYFFQDLWAARLIHNARPARHVDIGSRIDGFVAHVLTFMPVEVIDIRPLNSAVHGLRFVQADATNLNGIADDSIESLSCLHAVEHFGLGRYTDPIDPDACFAAMRAMQRVLKPGGRLYFSVPTGVERVEFNAQRVFAPDTVLATFDALPLVSFAAVDDAGAFRAEVQPPELRGARYACGLYEFTK